MAPRVGVLDFVTGFIFVEITFAMPAVVHTKGGADVFLIFPKNVMTLSREKCSHLCPFFPEKVVLLNQELGRNATEVTNDKQIAKYK